MGRELPHPNATHEADEADLVDLVPLFAAEAAAQKRLLVDNPAKLGRIFELALDLDSPIPRQFAFENKSRGPIPRRGGLPLKPAAFAYAKARSLDDAIRLLGAHEGEAKLLAGGQSLIATLNMRLSSPSLLVDINGIAGLDGISVKNGMVEIGAMTRHVTLERSSDIAKFAPLIARAMPHIAHPAIRNRGTIGGSLAYADPAAELPACLVALDGEIDIVGTRRQAQREGRRLPQGPVRDRARTT